MNKLISAMLALGFVLAGLFFAAPAQASSDKVPICHATESRKNPFNFIDVDRNGVISGHAGVGHMDGKDIIPVFKYDVEENGQTVRHTFPGQNTTKLASEFTIADCPGGSDPEALIAAPIPPVYVPPTCLTSAPGLTPADDAFYGTVTIPDNLGTGVKSASGPFLSEDKSVWTVTYTLVDGTEDVVYSWPADTTGVYSFNATPLSADKMYVIDAETRVGACELSDTGAGEVALIVGGGALLLGLGAAAVYFGRRTESE